MKDAMALGIRKEKFDCTDLRKCGEITIRMSVEKKETFLNCEFCDYSFLQLEYFVQHVYEEHLSNLVELGIKQESTKSILRPEEEREFVETGIQFESSFETTDEEQMVLNGFEKVEELELDGSVVNNSLHIDEAENTLIQECPQSCEANEGGSILDETDSDSEFDWSKPFVKNNEEERQSKKKFIIEFIEVYRSLPALWNTNLNAYQDNVLKNEQYEILLKKYQEKYPKATLKCIKQKLKGFRSQYWRAARLTALNGISTLYYYDAMNFLHDIKPRTESHTNNHALDEAPEKDDASLSNEIVTDKDDSDSEIADDDEDIAISRNKEDIMKKKEITPKRKFILEFIALYQSLTALWDSKCGDYYNRVVKNKQYEKLVAKYREKYPDATKDNVKSKIKNIRSNFLKVSRRKGPKHLYYYDAMTFLLKNNPQYKSRNKTEDLKEDEVKFEPTLDIFTVPDSLLTDAQFIKLAEIHKKYACLWDERDIAYRFANRRREARTKLLDEFNSTTGMNLMKIDLEKEVARLRKMCSNEKKQKIACKRKNVAYKPTCPYYDHIAYLEVDVTPFECSLCGQIISGICQYKVHLSSHDGSLPFKCHVCGHGFKLATNLAVHCRRHVQDYTYKCEVCNKPCATTTELKIHLRLHTGEKPYVCHYCGKTYASFAELRTHSERSHEKQRRHKCEICSKAFYEKQKLKDHMNAHLKIRDSVCNVCNKGFTSRKILRQHKLIHNVEKKYECKICLKRFAQSAGLNSHMKSHGVKPFD